MKTLATVRLIPGEAVQLVFQTRTVEGILSLVSANRHDDFAMVNQIGELCDGELVSVEIAKVADVIISPTSPVLPNKAEEDFYEKAEEQIKQP